MPTLPEEQRDAIPETHPAKVGAWQKVRARPGWIFLQFGTGMSAAAILRGPNGEHYLNPPYEGIDTTIDKILDGEIPPRLSFDNALVVIRVLYPDLYDAVYLSPPYWVLRQNTFPAEYHPWSDDHS